MSIWETLKKRRQVLGMDITEVARLSGLSRNTIASAEQGTFTSMRTLDKHARAIGLRLSLVPPEKVLEYDP